MSSKNGFCLISMMDWGNEMKYEWMMIEIWVNDDRNMSEWW
jgi:hypothetical protein